MNGVKSIDLVPWQAEVDKAIRRGARYVYLKCGRKSGKTKFIEHRIIENGKKEPIIADQVNAYIAPSHKQAKNILWRRLKLSIPREEMESRPRESDLIIDMKAGIRTQLFGAENEDGIRGLTFGPSTLDEADFMRAGFYEEVVEPNFSVTKAPCVMASTPKNRWFTKRWKQAKDGRLGKDHVAFHFTIYDNPYIDRKQIADLKASTPTEVWEQEYMANELAYSGMQYSEFENKHIVPHREPKADSFFARALDWGWEHPSHCLWGEIWLNPMTGRWNLYIYREWSGRGMNIAALVTPILSVDQGKNFIFTVIDGSAKRTEMASGESILTQFYRANLPCRLPYGTDDYKINAAKMMLKQFDVQISEKCPTLIKQLREVEWGDKYGDDAADCYKYFSSMVYGRDFSHMQPEAALDMKNPLNGPIDPSGILAGRDNGAMQWDTAGYLA